MTRTHRSTSNMDRHTSHSSKASVDIKPTVKRHGAGKYNVGTLEDDLEWFYLNDKKTLSSSPPRNIGWSFGKSPVDERKIQVCAVLIYCMFTKVAHTHHHPWDPITTPLASQ
jgi:hypothetical protein